MAAKRKAPRRAPRKAPKKKPRKAKAKKPTKSKRGCKGKMCRRVEQPKAARKPLSASGAGSRERGLKKKLNFKRPSPAISAVALPIGSVRAGNDGNLYVVTGITMRGKLVHRWVRA